MRFPNASPTLNFGEAIERAANNLLNINGRSRRSEFWWTMLVVAISFMIPCISSIVILLTIPLTIRRLHDTGRSGLLLAGDIILSFYSTYEINGVGIVKNNEIRQLNTKTFKLARDVDWLFKANELSDFI